MDPSSATAIASLDAESLLRSFLGGERGGKLRSQLASLHPESSLEEIEEAIQVACDRFIEKAEGISAPGQVYAWIRITAHRVLNREVDHHGWELAVDPTDESLQTLAEDASPEERLIAHEDQEELAALVREVSSALSERKRQVLALYAAGYKRPQIAVRLGISERVVKRDLLAIMDAARVAIACRVGGGCERGEPLVLRFAYRLATRAESEQARLHMTRCRRCEVLCERLDAWREKAGALLPVPAAEAASPGLLERLAHRTADGLSSLKQQALGSA
ncbi:MAG TPA: sigma-70 family RNA polymerase sigma factor, partial [Solirubrobacterales bacterium]|nr:sigma-70 family RNA polymerase sigma factor [Solirubrobacterales bacterium]